MLGEEIKIQSRDYWFKVIEFLQQNWSLIEETENGKCIVYFFGDTSGVFDRLEFNSIAESEQALTQNGFCRYSEDKQAQEFIA